MKQFVPATGMGGLVDRQISPENQPVVNRNRSAKAVSSPATRDLPPHSKLPRKLSNHLLQRLNPKRMLIQAGNLGKLLSSRL